MKREESSLSVESSLDAAACHMLRCMKALQKNSVQM